MHLLCLTLLDALLVKVFEAHVGVRYVYHSDAELLGSRNKMSNKTQVKDLAYADNMCLVTDSRDSMERLLHNLDC